MNDEKILQLRLYVKNKLDRNMNGHGFDHADRVYKNIMKLLTFFPAADKELCCAAGLIHDLIDDKVVDDVSLELNDLKSFLCSLEYSDSFIRDVFFIIENMSFRKQKKGIFSNMIEGQIVQDADRLDAIGAIGIARAFMYGGSKGNDIYVEGDDTNQTIIGHFHAKLYKIIDDLNTEPAQQIALKRTEFMRSFEDHIIREINGEI